MPSRREWLLLIHTTCAGAAVSTVSNRHNWRRFACLPPQAAKSPNVVGRSALARVWSSRGKRGLPGVSVGRPQSRGTRNVR